MCSRPSRPVFQLDEDAEVGDLGHGAVHNHAWVIGLWNRSDPRILGELLDAKTDALLLLIDLQHDAFNRITLLVLLVGVRDLLGPRHIRDVQQAVDARLDFDEGAVVGQVANSTSDNCAGGVSLGDQLPRVQLGLLEAQ